MCLFRRKGFVSKHYTIKAWLHYHVSCFYTQPRLLLWKTFVNLLMLGRKNITDTQQHFYEKKILVLRFLILYTTPPFLPPPSHLAPFLLQLDLNVHEFAPEFLVGGLRWIGHHLRFLRLPSLFRGLGRWGCGWWHSTLAVLSGQTWSAGCGKRRTVSVTAPPPCNALHHHKYHVSTAIYIIARGCWDFLLDKSRQAKRMKMGKVWVSVQNWVKPVQHASRVQFTWYTTA